MIRALFRLLSLWRDARAMSRGRYPQRAIRKRAHRGLGRLLR
jgi:hypothetical protein